MTYCEIKKEIHPERVFVEAYDKDGNVIAWSNIPQSVKDTFTDWEICELYKRQVGADSCKVY